MALADREWRLVCEETWDGPTNMAFDEVAAATAADGGPRTARVYRWDPGTLSLGYNQEPGTVDWAFCEREGIAVTRRPTGGGGIYHDTYDDISYTIVAPADELPGDLMDSYALLCEPILDAFERMGVPAAFAEQPQPALYHPACYLRKLHPAHDVVAGPEGDRRKISGNAQYRRKDVIVQHGSLKYDLRADRHLSTFDEPEVSVDELRDRVTTIREQAGIAREEAVEALAAALGDWADAEAGAWTAEEVSAARERASVKFRSDAWVREGADPLD
jgi:lipoate-protein ligase A